MNVRGLSDSLLAWFAVHGRRLPWREKPEPYAVVVSEFMLQQTQVDRVLPLFTAFMAAFPSFEMLAAAPRASVLRAWKGLGYNSRAVRLHELAREIVRERGGALAHDDAALRALPGIGPYTAAAVRAFAFNLDVVPVDTNVRRVVQRVFYGLEFPAPRRAEDIERAARTLLTAGRARELAGALMDLGATICTARAPKCPVCPLQDRCAASPVDGTQLAAARTAYRALRAPAPAFETTARYARGRIVDALRALPPGSGISLLDLHAKLPDVPVTRTRDGLLALVRRLEREGLVQLQNDRIALAEA